ncbi:MAG: transporter substrate-binding domain-containing protein [Myxococcota bacterium]|nr:transporter substrate-binding domain-containing protein [Myxococcota bacterium]
MVVGTHASPPFAMKGPDGSWRGLSIGLWRILADDLDIAYRIEERPLEGLIQGLQDGSLDVVAAALTTTADREVLFDFTHAYFLSGLAIGVPLRGRGAFSPWSLISGEFARMAAVVLAGVVAASLAILAFERTRNREQFGGSGLQSVGEALWWAAVTMTTVGYGDKAPRTAGGRIVAVIWMLAGVMLISAFTATIASNLTVNQIGRSISGPDDLPGRRVASVSGSTSEDYLLARGIVPIRVSSPRKAVQELMEGRADAVVYDEVILRYVSLSEAEVGMELLPFEHGSQAYAFGLKPGSALRERLNRAVLKHTEGDLWPALVARYLGR